MLLVPSREQVRTQQSLKTNYPAPTVEEYALASPDDAAPAKPARVNPGGKKKQAARDEVTLECPTCHELVKATVSAQPGRIPCTFCETPLAVPDRQTLAGWQSRKIAPPSAAEVGEYAAAPVHQGPKLRPGGVFDRLAEIRQEAVPLPPTWTFFSGVFQLPWRNDTIIRWAYLSVGFTLITDIMLPIGLERPGRVIFGDVVGRCGHCIVCPADHLGFAHDNFIRGSLRNVASLRSESIGGAAWTGSRAGPIRIGRSGCRS